MLLHEVTGRQLRDARQALGFSLSRLAATSEVLQVIASSPGELEPVFQAMLTNAVRVCEAQFGVLFRYSDNAFHVGCHARRAARIC